MRTARASRGSMAAVLVLFSLAVVAASLNAVFVRSHAPKDIKPLAEYLDPSGRDSFVGIQGQEIELYRYRGGEFSRTFHYTRPGNGNDYRLGNDFVSSK